MAKKLTIEKKIVDYLELCGYKEIPSKSKYRTFEKPGLETKLFVGKRGALRKGRIATKSIPVYGTSLTHEKINALIGSKLISMKNKGE